MSLAKISTTSDQELLNSLKSGDKKAFAIIYDNYWKRLLSISYKIVGDKTLAEEVVQEVFISLWKRKETVEINVLESYLVKAVKFGSFKVFQRERRHEEIQNLVYSNLPHSFEDTNLDDRMLHQLVDEVVEKLPEKCRLVFKLSRESYLTNKEISQNLSISEKSVEAHITRALKFLKYNLQRAGILFFLIAII